MSPETPPPPDDPASRPKARPPRIRLYRLVLASLLLFLGAGGGYLYLEREFDTPAREGDATPVLFQVRPGMGLKRIVHALGEKSLIKKPILFIYQVRLRGGAKRLHAGYYALRPSMSPREIYRDIVEGRRVVRTITIPEGYNLRELARVIEDSGLAEYGEILALAHSAEFLSSLRVGAASAEGYLFPDTYRFPLGAPARKILNTLADTMKRKLDDKLRRRADELGFTVHEVLTLASIVEKETSLDGERPLIASVFLNRLRRNMRLQSDPPPSSTPSRISTGTFASATFPTIHPTIPTSTKGSRRAPSPAPGSPPSAPFSTRQARTTSTSLQPRRAGTNSRAPTRSTGPPWPATN